MIRRSTIITIPNKVPGAMSGLTVVCHQIRSPDNLGAIARLMANFGLSRLVLSDPVTMDLRAAEKLAIGAEQVLRDVAVAQSLPEALTGCVYALGTTSRAVKGRTMLTPQQAAQALRSHAARGPIALVLGGEKRGLSDEDLACCAGISAVQTSAAQPSLNVSQAAALYFWLWSIEGAPANAAPPEGARLQTLQALEKKMGEVLQASGFLNPQAPGHVLKELSRSLVNGRLSQREAELWLSAFEHLRRATSSASPPGD
jgi:tRNA/rRNA methyltransferase